MAVTKQDQLAVIKVEGMHCHRCERQIKNSLSAMAGVHEVEVDFPSAQVSVLYNGAQVQPRQLMDAINQAGYKAITLLQAAQHPAV